MEISMAETGPDFILSEMVSLRSRSDYTDVLLLTGSDSFVAHRPVLAAISPFLAHLMSVESNVDDPLRITVEDTEPEVVEAFLRLAYTGEVSCSNASLRGRLVKLLRRLRVTADVVVVDENMTSKEENNMQSVNHVLGSNVKSSRNEHTNAGSCSSNSTAVDMEESPLVSTESSSEFPLLSGHTLFSSTENASLMRTDKASLDARTRLMLEPSSESSKCRCLTCSMPTSSSSSLPLSSASSSRSIHVCHYPECRRQYKKSSHLRAHLRTHIGDQPFVCPWQGCGRRFTRSDELHRHYRIHTGEKNHKCSKCDKMFARSDHLKKHLRQHDNEQLKLSRQQRQHQGTQEGALQHAQQLHGGPQEHAFKHLPRHLMGFFNNSNFQSS